MSHQVLPRAQRYLAVAIVAVGGAFASSPRSSAVAETDLLAYRMVAQWPERLQAATGLFQSPIDLDVTADGRVLVADAGISGVHLLLPSGVFTSPFGVTGGYPAQLGRVGQVAVGPVPGADAGEERFYVLDPGTERLVVYDRDGRYVTAWANINARGVAASSDGRIYLLDRERSEVRVLDADRGTERFAFGARGTDDGQFNNFSDVAVSPDGRVAAVADMQGQRVQLFDLATDDALGGEDPPPPATLRKVYNLLSARFNKGEQNCRGTRVNALGEDAIFVGEGVTACLIDSTDVTFAIATSANDRTICRQTVRLPALRADTSQYFALATYDPNSGACGEKRTDLPTTPVVVRYDDDVLKIVRTVWQADDAADRRDPALFGPRKLSLPTADRLFVADSSSKLRYYALDGTALATVARDSSERDQGTDTEFYRLTDADGTEALDEVYATYTRIKRSATNAEFESGIGRFRNVVKTLDTGPVDVAEPVWTMPIAGATGGSGRPIGGGGRMRVEIPSMAYNPASGEVLLVRNEIVDQQRTVDMKLARYAADGARLADTWDLPDDGSVNPYTDISVGPDGRIYLLDDLSDLVRVLGVDGVPLVDVPVSFDARSVAGGPPSTAGSVFVLREPGAIERYADDGTVTARLDGRPLAYSDPTTLSDIAVDGAGRVYVADGQASLISVFAASDDADVLPVPSDATCLFRAVKTAAPSRLRLGESTTVNLALDGACGVDEDPTDIVVVVPYYRELAQGRDASSGTMNQMVRLVSRLSFARHRIGIVSYWDTYNLELPLTSDHDAYNAAARAVRRFTPPSQDVRARLRNAMERAAGLYDADGSRRKVMVLLNPQYCDATTARRPEQCTGYPPAEDAAAAIRAAGVTIIVSGGNGSNHLASSDEDVVQGDQGLHRRMVRYHIPAVLASSVDVRDEVPGNMTLDVSSIDAGGRWSAPTVHWSASAIDFTGMRLRFRLSPALAGRWPTNVLATADIVDGWGAAQHLVFPVPEVEVIGPTPTLPAPPPAPSPAPSATAAPTGATPTATSTPSRVFLPWTTAGVCLPDKTRLDVVLVIDASVSMTGAKMDAARTSVAGFLDAVRLGDHGDHAALVAFADEAVVVRDLTADRGALDAALAGLAISPGTRIDRGLALALDVLRGEAARPWVGKAVVLLSDGRQSDAVEALRSVGAAGRARGVEVFTVGLGDDADAALLAEIATDASHYAYSPDADALAATYARIASALSRCP